MEGWKIALIVILGILILVITIIMVGISIYVTYYQILIAVVVLIMLLAILIIGALILYILGPQSKPTFDTGDVITLGVLIGGPQDLASSFNVIAEINNADQCANPYNALDLAVGVSKFSEFTIQAHSSRTDVVALKAANNTYCYLNSEKVIKYITFGKTTINEDDATMWFGYETTHDGNYNLTVNGKNVGLVKVTGDNLKCYTGQILVQSDGTEIAYLIGVNSENTSQPFYITNLTTPIRPTGNSYSFTTNDLITVTSNNLKLTGKCQGNNVVMANSTTNNQWKVTMSDDNQAFALSLDDSYLTPTVGISSFYNNTVSSISLNVNSKTLSNYTTGDYTNWFTLSGNKLVSLWLNSSFYMNPDIGAGCSGVTAYIVYGSLISNGTEFDVSK